MRWANNDLRYIRPIKWLLALKDQELISSTINQVQNDIKTYGHRFLGRELTIDDPMDYQDQLAEQFVIANRVERKKIITDQIKQLIKANEWDKEIDQALLEEVTDLVEYPTTFVGTFNTDYLVIPVVTLITSMIFHLRYFLVLYQQGNLLLVFIIVK